MAEAQGYPFGAPPAADNPFDASERSVQAPGNPFDLFGTQATAPRDPFAPAVNDNASTPGAGRQTSYNPFLSAPDQVAAPQLQQAQQQQAQQQQPAQQQHSQQLHQVQQQQAQQQQVQQQHSQQQQAQQQQAQQQHSQQQQQQAQQLQAQQQHAQQQQQAQQQQPLPQQFPTQQVHSQQFPFQQQQQQQPPSIEPQPMHPHQMLPFSQPIQQGQGYYPYNMPAQQPQSFSSALVPTQLQGNSYAGIVQPQNVGNPFGTQALVQSAQQTSQWTGTSRSVASFDPFAPPPAPVPQPEPVVFASANQGYPDVQPLPFQAEHQLVPFQEAEQAVPFQNQQQLVPVQGGQVGFHQPNPSHQEDYFPAQQNGPNPPPVHEVRAIVGGGRSVMSEPDYPDTPRHSREMVPYVDRTVPERTMPEASLENKYSRILAQQAPPDAAPLPKTDLVVKSGYVLSRISFRTILMKKWKQTYWIQYGRHTMLWFRSQSDCNEWLNNPYLTQAQRNFLIKLAVNFVHDLYKPNVRGYQVTHARTKAYGRKLLRQFKLERWMDYGPTIAAAFASYDPKEVDAMREAIVQCMRNTPLEGGIRATGAVRQPSLDEQHHGSDDGHQHHERAYESDRQYQQHGGQYAERTYESESNLDDNRFNRDGAPQQRSLSDSNIPQGAASVASAVDLLDDTATAGGYSAGNSYYGHAHPIPSQQMHQQFVAN